MGLFGPPKRGVDDWELKQFHPNFSLLYILQSIACRQSDTVETLLYPSPTNSMASNPGARCCTIGVKHEGEAKGEVKNIGKSGWLALLED